MKIQLQRKGYSISCRHCFINFKGHAICSGCAKGYLLRDLEGKGETGLARLVHVFTLVESRTERNTIRPEIFNPDAETDTVVRYSKVMFRGGLTAMYTHHEYSIETTKCPECQAGSLLYTICRNSECPNCGKDGLSRKDAFGQVKTCSDIIIYGPVQPAIEALQKQFQVVLSHGSEMTYRFLRQPSLRMSRDEICKVLAKRFDMTPEEFSQLSGRLDAEDQN